MGTVLIIPTADFSENAILRTYMRIKIAPNSSVQMHYNSGGTIANYGEPIVNSSNSPKEFCVDLTDYCSEHNDGMFLLRDETALLEVFIFDNKGILAGLNYAFYNCTSLKKCVIVASVLSVLRSTFYSCQSLNDLSIKKTGEVTSLNNAFRKSGLKTLDLSRITYGSLVNSGLERIFDNSGNLVTVDMSNIILSSGVKSVVSNMFTLCPSFAKVYVDNVAGTYTDPTTDLGYIYSELPTPSSWTFTTEGTRKVFIKS